MGLIDGYIKILQGFTQGQDALQINTDFHDYLAKRNPVFRMFLDSDFNSETEIAVKKMRVDAHVAGIRNKLPKGKISEKLATFIGTRIGDAENAVLDRTKLRYKYSKGQITLDEYQDIRSTQIQATIVNIYKKTKWIARHALKSLFGFDEDSSTASKLGFGFLIRKGEKLVEKELSSEPVKKVLKAAVATVHTGVVIVKKAYDTVKEFVIDPVIQTVGKVVKKGAEALVEFGHKAEKAVGKAVDWVEDKWEKFKGLFGRKRK